MWQSASIARVSLHYELASCTPLGTARTFRCRLTTAPNPSVTLTNSLRVLCCRRLILRLPRKLRLSLMLYDGIPGARYVTSGTCGGWYIPAHPAASRKLTVLYLHGNAGNRASYHRTVLYNKLSQAGVGVFAFDYRGFGDSAGYPDENGVAADAMGFWERVFEELECEPDEVIVWGHSLGSAVAVKLVHELVCSNLRLPAGLVLEAPFTSVLDVVLSRLPTWTQDRCAGMLSRLLQHQWCSIDRVREVAQGCPVALLHGSDDAVVPFELGVRLHATASDCGAKFYGFAGATHDWIVEHESFSHVLTEILEHCQLDGESSLIK